VNNSYTVESLYQEELYVLNPKVLIILPMPWEEVDESDQLLLAKILGSVKINLASVQILAYAEFRINDLTIYNPSKILVFGSRISDQKAPIKPYQPSIENKVTVLQADSLHQLDDSKKKSLWTALKEMFAI